MAHGVRTGFSGSALIIEDDAMIALNLQDMLQSFGFDPVDIAHTAEAAEARAAARYAFAVVDIRLAGGDSIRAANKLRANGTPFIFTTGYSEISLLDPALAATPYLTKPFEEAALYAALVAATKKSPAP